MYSFRLKTGSRDSIGSDTHLNPKGGKRAYVQIWKAERRNSLLLGDSQALEANVPYLAS